MGIHIKGIDMPPEGQGRILLVKGDGEVSDWFDLERKVVASAEGVVEEDAIFILESLPSAQPEHLTDDDFETIRICLDACKEKLCNQSRWKEAKEYQRIYDRFMAFASAQPERPEQPESAKEYCAECDHIEMCRWYPYEGCEFRGLPSAQSEQRWIPCSNSLPEESGKYLITANDGIHKRTTVAKYQHRHKTWEMTGRMAYWKVLAWRPLPGPWKGEDNETD